MIRDCAPLGVLLSLIGPDDVRTFLFEHPPNNVDLVESVVVFRYCYGKYGMPNYVMTVGWHSKRDDILCTDMSCMPIKFDAFVCSYNSHENDPDYVFLAGLHIERTAFKILEELNFHAA